MRCWAVRRKAHALGLKIWWDENLNLSSQTFFFLFIDQSHKKIHLCNWYNFAKQHCILFWHSDNKTESKYFNWVVGTHFERNKIWRKPSCNNFGRRLVVYEVFSCWKSALIDEGNVYNFSENLSMLADCH